MTSWAGGFCLRPIHMTVFGASGNYQERKIPQYIFINILRNLFTLWVARPEILSWSGCLKRCCSGARSLASALLPVWHRARLRPWSAAHSGAWASRRQRWFLIHALASRATIGSRVTKPAQARPRDAFHAHCAHAVPDAYPCFRYLGQLATNTWLPVITL